MKTTLIATTSSGLEAIVKREVQALGFQVLAVSPGKVEIEADPEDIPKLNLWLRCAGRVQVKMGEFEAVTFDDLFEGTRDLPWENWITQDGKFIVNGKSVKSTLGSVRACQSIVKKAVVERLKRNYKTDWFEETGPEFTIQVALRKDITVLTIDTSGSGLNKRGYRAHSAQASLRETLAAALVKLSFWKEDRLLIDPMCGAGTILIEAAMIARNMAPGLRRSFASEAWPIIDPQIWLTERQQAADAILPGGELKIYGYDLAPENVIASQVNAKNAGVAGDIDFQEKDVRDLWIDQQYGILITNPPYGEKMGDFKEINKIYVSLNKTFRKKKGWSVYVLTGDKKFPDYFKRARPDRVRKLYNGVIEVNYYQYFGERPNKNR
jgi:putative N6-adenine-specific DNA methylase